VRWYIESRSTAARPGGRTPSFTATSRRRTVSVARHTVPMPPWPIAVRSAYRPPMTVPGAPRWAGVGAEIGARGAGGPEIGDEGAGAPETGAGGPETELDTERGAGGPATGGPEAPDAPDAPAPEVGAGVSAGPSGVAVAGGPDRAPAPRVGSDAAAPETEPAAADGAAGPPGPGEPGEPELPG